MKEGENMRITDLLDSKSICLEGTPGSKNEALDQMVDLMARSGKINDLEAYRRQVYLREHDRNWRWNSNSPWKM